MRGNMNWKVLGSTLAVLALCGLGLGLSAGWLADKSVGLEKQANWAMDCFRGILSQCAEEGTHRAFVTQWKDYGMYAAIASGVLLVAGIAILAGSISSAKQA
jgi:hypothetical protein